MTRYIGVLKKWKTIFVFLSVSVNIREEERETLIEKEVGKRLTISLPIIFASFFFFLK